MTRLYNETMPALSVVIPTHGRPEILKKCLAHLREQTVRSALEILVVSDEHDPKTREVVAQAQSSDGTPVIRLVEVEKCQQGVARNHGVQKATSPLVLFIGDDIFLDPEACQKHLEAHSQAKNPRFPIAVLGSTSWDPAVGITPVMRWLDHSGWQFGYRFIERHAHEFLPQKLQARFTYTSHVSLPTHIAKNHPFSREMTLYGWEDIEWGMRLRQSGVRLFYEPDAKGLHHHHLSLEESLKRMEILGESITHAHAISPQMDRLPQGWKLLAYRVMALLPTMGGRHRKTFLRGLHRKA